VMPGLQLVIADQRDPPSIDTKAPHAIGAIRHDQAVIHAIAEAGKDSIGKTTRQIEQVPFIGNQCAIALGCRCCASGPVG